MADEKEFKNLTTGIKGIGGDDGVGGRKDPYVRIGELIGITFSKKDKISTMRTAIIANNATNPTRNFAEILKKMNGTNAVNNTTVANTETRKSVTVHTANVSETSASANCRPVAYPSCDASSLNREMLSEQIHTIHNFLRNRGVGYGMSALKRFNLFYGLARIEQFDLFSIVGLNESCRFSELLKLAQSGQIRTETDSCNPIYDLVDKYLDEINSNIMMKKFIMSELPRGIQEDTLAQLIIKINQLLKLETQINEQICGKVYEYFIGRDQTAISELGAYFTNRSITQFIYEQLAPKLDADGKVQSMIDPFGGSGGFTTGYVMNLRARFPEIDWKDGISKVYHFDMNNDVVRYAALELMCLTHALPNMCDNMICENSFATERFSKYKYVCTNPPYGGDNIAESASQKMRKILKDKLTAEITLLKTTGDVERLKRRESQLAKVDAESKAEDIENDKQKVKTDSPSTSQFIKNYARENNLFVSESRAGRQVLFGNDKEATSLILIAALAAPGGTAVGVLKEGIFFNSKYALLRKHLIEKFNVRKVISIPADQFENTTTKTSIIIFDNDPEKKTSRIDFSELKVTTFEQDEFGEDSFGNLVVIGARGAFREVHEYPVSSASLAELQKTIGTKQLFSLDGKQYSMHEPIPGHGYKMIKLGNLCAFMTKSQRPASFGKTEGKYPFYSSSATVKRCDVADYNSEAIIIGNGGSANIALDEEFSCSDCNFVLQSAIVPIRYVYYILRGNIQLLQSGFHGSVLAHISKAFVSDLKIPVLEDSAKMNEWVAKISVAYDARRAAEAKISELEIKIHSIIRSVCESGAYDEYKLNEMLVKRGIGSQASNAARDVGMYPIYSAVAKNPIGMIDTFDHDCDDYLLFATSGGSSKTIFGVTLGIGKFWRVSGRIACTGHVSIYEFMPNIKRNWLIHYLSFALYDIQRLANYSTGLGGIKSNAIDSFPIKIAKDESILASIDELSSQHSCEKIKYSNADSEFKKLIAELAREATSEWTRGNPYF